jgi:hypothetical protein
MFIGDYEFATGWAVVRPTWLMCPEVIPTSAIHCDPDRIFKYPGIKEDVYVPRFVPDAGIRPHLGLEQDALVVTLRPPANEAHYHNPESERLFDAAVERLSGQQGVKLIAVPRNDKQAASLKQKWPALFSSGVMRIPEQVVDGLNLIWHSDLVISGGGTMNREAAALGVPVYSVFRGKIGAVDRYLSAQGRLVLLESVEDVKAKIAVVRRQRPANPECGDRRALTSIVERIVAVLESPAHVPGAAVSESYS